MVKCQKIKLCLLIISASVFFGNQNALAQEKKKTEIALKSYVNSILYLGPDRNIQSGLLSFAVNRKNENGNFQEYELSKIEQTSNYYPIFSSQLLPYDQGVSIESYALKLRYEVSFSLLQRDSKIAPYFGISASPSVASISTNPSNVNSFPTVRQAFGINLSVVPRIQWNIGSRLFLDLNTPLTIMDGFNARFIVRDPRFTMREQLASNRFDLTTFTDISFRLGLGVKL
jgi:hypothetical protein